MEKKIENLMTTLGISREEALQVIEDDARIDKGEKLFELTDEQKKVAKQAMRADKKVSETKVKRERKENNDKQALITTLAEALNAVADSDCEITNKERELNFVYKNVKYKVVLSAPRS